MKFFCTFDMTLHLKDVHSNDAHVLYDQTPNLSGMQAENVSGELAECLHEADVELEGSGSD